MESDQALPAMIRAMRRAARAELLRLKRGDASVRTIVWLAPALGSISMLHAIAAWLKTKPWLPVYGCVGGGPAEALVTVSIGLAVAFVARMVLHCLDLEFAALALELGVVER